MAHINYKYDYTVEVFIVHKNKVLLRYHDKYDMWLSVGGHIELDEDPNEAAIREVKEEVGLDITLFSGNKPFNHEDSKYKELIPPLFLNSHLIKGDHWHIGLTYIATSESDDVKPQLESDQSDNWKWVGEDEINSMKDLDENIKTYALKALEILSK